MDGGGAGGACSCAACCTPAWVEQQDCFYRPTNHRITAVAGVEGLLCPW